MYNIQTYLLLQTRLMQKKKNPKKHTSILKIEKEDKQNQAHTPGLVSSYKTSELYKRMIVPQ